MVSRLPTVHSLILPLGSILEEGSIWKKKKKFFLRLLTQIIIAVDFNPLVPSVANMRRNAKILILILEGIIKKISYEHRDYELVDEKTYLSLCPEKLRKKESRK